MKSQILSLACLLLWAYSATADITLSRTVKTLDTSVATGKLDIEGCTDLDQYGCKSFSLDTPANITVSATGEIFTDFGSDAVISVSATARLLFFPVNINFDCSLCGSDCEISIPLPIPGLPNPIVIPTPACPIEAGPIDFSGPFEVPDIPISGLKLSGSASIKNGGSTVLDLSFNGDVN